jgi:hypothetical protein
MGRADGRIEPGQPLKSAISARAWNRAQDAADIVLGERTRFAAGASTSSSAPFVSTVCLNSTGSVVPRWGIVAITGVAVYPGGDDDPRTKQFEASPILTGGMPSASTARFAVALEPLAVGAYGRVAVSGVVPVRVEIRSGDHTSCGPKDSVEELVSGRGGARFLWKSSGNDLGNWALVALGEPEPHRLGKIDSTWTKGDYRPVEHLDENGDSLDPQSFFYATNWFSDVEVEEDSSKKVLCIEIHGAWLLVAAEC